jgi:hypothetical protein
VIPKVEETPEAPAMDSLKKVASLVSSTVGVDDLGVLCRRVCDRVFLLVEVSGDEMMMTSGLKFDLVRVDFFINFFLRGGMLNLACFLDECGPRDAVSTTLPTE